MMEVAALLLGRTFAGLPLSAISKAMTVLVDSQEMAARWVPNTYLAIAIVGGLDDAENIAGLLVHISNSLI